MQTVAIEAAKKGGEILLHYFENLPSVEEKGVAGDLVTIADKKSEEVILTHLRKHFPDHSFLAEESGEELNQTSPYTWIIDPLDGTTNFAHRFPVFSITIALQKAGETILGLVFDPIRDELFVAEKGLGSHLNGKKLAVSKTERLEKSLLATGFAYDRRFVEETNYPEFCRMTHITHGVRRLGSAALDLSWVAAGRLEGFWERGLKSWDMAAGALLVAEAGGQVTDFDGAPFDLFSGRILASCGGIHDEMRKELLKAPEEFHLFKR